MGVTVLFDIIHGSHCTIFYCTISAYFYFYLQYFQQKSFNLNKISGSQMDTLYFLLLFMGLTALFNTIHEFHSTILANFHFYLQYFKKKKFSFNKINGSQTNSKKIFRIFGLIYLYNRSQNFF